MMIRSYALYAVFVLILGHRTITLWTVSTYRIRPFDGLSSVASPRSQDWPSREHLQKIKKAKDKSYVEYSACCGLGHRLSKMVDAFHIARTRNFGMRVFWEFCGDGTEGFHHFFGPQPLSELESVQDGREVIKVMNEAPCVDFLDRRGGDIGQCRCPSDYIESNGIFFNGLVERFRFKEEVDKFRRHHRFDAHFVLGMHVRAGNGEIGDFTEKDRTIHNVTSWVESVTAILLTMSRNATRRRPPLLFLATDTASMVDTLRQALSGHMDVVVFEQERLPEGSGVLFGEHGSRDKLNVTSELCHDMKNALMDMMVLTSSDVVISGNPSSFTQSLPMGVALSRDHTQYCEVSPKGTYQCYQTFQEWCCQGKPFRSREYIKVPQSECEIPSQFIVERPESETQRLPSPGNSPPMDTFLPYDWDHIDWNHSSG